MISSISSNISPNFILWPPFEIIWVCVCVCGQFVSIKVASGEPNWIISFKKSIASQLQLDITGVRSDDVQSEEASPEDFNYAVNTFEDTITGDCSTGIQVNRLPTHQVYGLDAHRFGSFETVCKDANVYEVVKTKDLNRCLKNPFYQSVVPSNYLCSLGRASCNDNMVVSF